MEIVAGAANKLEQQRSVRLLNQLALVQTNSTDIQWAMQQVLLFQLSHQVGVFDALIAATAHRSQLPFFTRNLKHVTPMLGLLAQHPY